MRIEILENGQVVNTIFADEEFAQNNFPGSWRIAAVQDRPQSPTQAIQAAISSMERDKIIDVQRITRETILGLAEERAAALGLTNAQLRAKNKGYAGLKALDEQIAALRAQL